MGTVVGGDLLEPLATTVVRVAAPGPIGSLSDREGSSLVTVTGG